jgi:hypothetical protein
MPTTELALPVTRESTYIVVWEFQVKAECEAEFVAAYGPDGEWARLFRRSPEFLGVELLGSVGNSARFFTLDHWSSASGLEVFLAATRPLTMCWIGGLAVLRCGSGGLAAFPAAG